MMKYSVDLEKESLKELRFLAVVAKHKGLLDPGNLLKWAIYRYTLNKTQRTPRSWKPPKMGHIQVHIKQNTKDS